MSSTIIKKLIKKSIMFDDGILRPHNKGAYVDLIDAMEKEENHRACAVRATGTGKMWLAIKWLKDNQTKPFIYLAPTNIILNRFVDSLLKIYSPENSGEIQTKNFDEKVKYLEKNFGLKLNLFTYAKINRMTEEEMQSIGAKHIVLDEFHRCGAEEWGKSVDRFLELHKDAQVMGLSATPIRSSDGKNMVDELFNGKIASELTLLDALKQEILPIPKMILAMYSFKDEIVSLQSQLELKKFDSEKKKEIEKTLREIKQRIGQAEGIKGIFRPYIEELIQKKGREDVKMIVFCKDIEDRDTKMDECKSWFDSKFKIKKYSLTSQERDLSVSNDSGELSKKEKLSQKVLRTFEQDNSKAVKLLFVVDMLNEGLHIDGIDGVIMMRDTSSNIIFSQQLGRALSAKKQNETDSPVLVFDLVNNSEVLMEEIKEFKEVLETISKNRGSKSLEEMIEYFTIQAEIIDLIQYLKDISSSFEERIVPLVIYCKNDNTTLADIKFNQQYTIDGEVYNIGYLINALRQNKKNGKLNPEEITRLEELGMVWDKILGFEERIEPLVIYCKKEQTSLADITRTQQYTIEGQVYNIGALIGNLRQEKKKGKLESEEVKRLEELGMVWDKILG